MLNRWMVAEMAYRKVILAVVICFAGYEAHSQWSYVDPQDDHKLGVLRESGILLLSIKYAFLYFLTGIIATAVFHGSRRINTAFMDFALFALWCPLTMWMTIQVKQ